MIAGLGGGGEPLEAVGRVLLLLLAVPVLGKVGVADGSALEVARVNVLAGVIRPEDGVADQRHEQAKGHRKAR